MIIIELQSCESHNLMGILVQDNNAIKPSIILLQEFESTFTVTIQPINIIQSDSDFTPDILKRAPNLC